MIKRLFLCGMIALSLTACGSGETIEKKHSFVEGTIRGIDSRCNSRYCGSYATDFVVLTTNNDVLVFKDHCNEKPTLIVGDGVTILKTVTLKSLSKGQTVERVSYAICY